MSKADQTVWTTRGSNTTNHYHEDQDCFNCPQDARAIALWKIQSTHDPCGRCSDGEGEKRKTEFVCMECGEMKELTSAASRTQSQCYECGELRGFERQ